MAEVPELRPVPWFPLVLPGMWKPWGPWQRADSSPLAPREQPHSSAASARVPATPAWGHSWSRRGQQRVVPSALGAAASRGWGHMGTPAGGGGDSRVTKAWGRGGVHRLQGFSMLARERAPAAVPRDTGDNLWSPLLAPQGGGSHRPSPQNTPQCHSLGLATPRLSPTRPWDCHPPWWGLSPLTTGIGRPPPRGPG